MLGCPSLDLATTILAELGERIELERLAQLTDLDTETSVLQHELGWLLDTTGWDEKTALLAHRLQQRRRVWQPLRTAASREGERHARWHIIVNTEVEVEA
jgi:hypothetical protein